MYEAPPRIFRSFWQAGFECSTHKLANGQRLDLLAATKHDRFATEDYRRLRSLGISTVRTGARWHLIETATGEYCFDSLQPTLRAAQQTGAELVLDLMHFGWPDHLDIFSPKFPEHFGRYTQALARFLKPYRAHINGFVPVNEMSYFAWAGGHTGEMNPNTIGAADELKRILVGASIAASEVLLNEWCDVRLISPEPVIHVVRNPDIERDDTEAAAFSNAQYQAWDMLCGRLHPELGGRPEYLDVLGVNFYDQNQWIHFGDILPKSDVRYKPFRTMLADVWERYRRPLFVSETGTEDEERAEWFHYVCAEVRASIEMGIPVYGICLYPIVNHPGWIDDRHCCNGLFDYADRNGYREIYEPLAKALSEEQKLFPALLSEPRKTVAASDAPCEETTNSFPASGRASAPFALQNNFHDHSNTRPDLPLSPALEIRVSTTTASDEPLCAERQSSIL